MVTKRNDAKNYEKSNYLNTHDLQFTVFVVFYTI